MTQHTPRADKYSTAQHDTGQAQDSTSTVQAAGDVDLHKLGLQKQQFRCLNNKAVHEQ
jgi:hypothetical protein